MKVFIWIMCFFLNAFLSTILSECGIRLGAIPTVVLYGTTIWLARTFCKKWGNYKEHRDDESAEKKARTPIIDSQNQMFISKNSQGKSEKTINESAFKHVMDDYIEATVEVMEANRKDQPTNENDIDFGLVAKKPIYTCALKSVVGEKEYLDNLYTLDGDKISYIRKGALSLDGVNGFVDIYDTYLSSGEFYKTIYINMYGAETSARAPSGFLLKDDKLSVPNSSEDKFCKLCGCKIHTKNKICPSCGEQNLKGTVFSGKSVAIVVLSLVVIAVATLCAFEYSNIKQQSKYIQNLEDKIDDLEEQIITNQSTIDELESTIDSLKFDLYEYEEIVDFVDEYVVFVEDDGTNQYHKYECYRFVGEYFWAYNVDAAKNKGYHACPVCN